MGACTVTCPNGATRCGDACVDTRYDPNHCGACDTRCGTGLFCSEGRCVSVCPAGTNRCGRSCCALCLLNLCVLG